MRFCCLLMWFQIWCTQIVPKPQIHNNHLCASIAKLANVANYNIPTTFNNANIFCFQLNICDFQFLSFIVTSIHVSKYKFSVSSSYTAFSSLVLSSRMLLYRFISELSHPKILVLLINCFSSSFKQFIISSYHLSIIIDSILFLASYYIQQKYIF